MTKNIQNFTNYKPTKHGDLLILYQHIKDGKIPHVYKEFDFDYDKKKNRMKITSKVDRVFSYGLTSIKNSIKALIHVGLFFLSKTMN